MSRNPDISVRRWIKWSDAEPEEPTSTLVLTSPKSNYVDIRVLLPSTSGSPRSSRPPSTTLKVLQNCSLDVAESSASQLDWAFAGTSSRTQATAERPGHGIWRRWVDSWQPNSKAHLLKDEGDLFPLHEGEEELELEKGNMLHPQTGRMADYEELWASGLAIPAHDGQSGQRVCVVLKTVDGAHDGNEADDDEERGMIIRVGQWIQGIVKRGDNILAERWVWTLAGAASPGNWRRVVCIQKPTDEDAGVSLPCAALMSIGEKLSEGQVLEHTKTGGIDWRVEEVVQW